MVAVKSMQNMEHANYARMKAVTDFLFDCLYSINVEGTLPDDGPRLLLAPHQNSLDGPSLIKAIDGYSAFVYGTYFAHIKLGLMLLGYMHVGGVRVNEHGIRAKKLFEHFNNKDTTFAFPQKHFDDAVRSYSSGIARLVKLHEERTKSHVAIVPTGISYTPPSKLPKLLPLPFFKFPVPGTSVDITFGDPIFRQGRTPKELTDVVMWESARLSGIDYQPT